MDVKAPVADDVSPRRRVLLLTPRFPYPPIGGDRLRILQMARAVSQTHQVTLLSLCQRKEELLQEVPDDGIFHAVHRVHLPRRASWWQAACALASAQPMQIAYFRSREFHRRARHLLAQSDLVWCHLARMAPYAENARVPRWLEMTDAISLTMERASRLWSPFDPRRWAYRLEARRMKRYERQLIDEFDLVTLIAEVDLEHLCDAEAPPARRVVVAPNGVALPSRPAAAAGERPPHIALVGRMDSLSNRDAMWFFVTQVLPGVVARAPRTRLRIVGHVLPADADRLRRINAVQVDGVVRELSDVLDQCRVGVCPVRFGAGIQNKLLDYMAHGLAAVSSPVGIEGLRVHCGQDLMMADSPAEWVEKIVLLMSDDATASALGAAGRAFVERHHQWSEALAPAIDAADRLLLQQTGASRLESTGQLHDH